MFQQKANGENLARACSVQSWQDLEGGFRSPAGSQGQAGRAAPGLADSSAKCPPSSLHAPGEGRALVRSCFSPTPTHSLCWGKAQPPQHGKPLLWLGRRSWAFACTRRQAGGWTSLSGLCGPPWEHPEHSVTATRRSAAKERCWGLGATGELSWGLAGVGSVSLTMWLRSKS